MAIPTVTADPASNRLGARVGIVFPTISGRNNMPIRPWTGINNYPCRE